MSGKYSKNSPYFRTAISNGFLGFYVHRTIPATNQDTEATLSEKYDNAPDLLAKDYFGDAELWWVIPQRNGIEDPVFGMKGGMKLIFPPKDIMERI